MLDFSCCFVFLHGRIIYDEPILSIAISATFPLLLSARPVRSNDVHRSRPLRHPKCHHRATCRVIGELRSSHFGGS
jgi:hypothetical protein